MMPTVKSDIRKLLSVRSTYILMTAVFLLVTLTAFYVEGVWGKSGSAAGRADASALKEIIGGSIGLAAIFISIIAALQIGHEYRYNTIAHTLTANPNRTKVFLSKWLVLSLFSIGFGLLVTVFSVIAYRIGLSIRGATLPPQDLQAGVQIFRVAFYCFVYGTIGFALSMLLRNVIGAIVLIFVLPAIEPLIALLLKDNARYLPITTFDHIMGVAIGQTDMTPNTAIIISSVYLGALGLITWITFLRRDAN